MYRKWLLMMLSLAVCLSLVACGDKQPPADSTPNNEVEDNVSDASITYNPEEFLPVGSVVMLNGGNKRVMICGRIQAQAGTDVIYDYSACYYPEGIPSSINPCSFSIAATLKLCISVAMRIRKSWITAMRSWSSWESWKFVTV